MTPKAFVKAYKPYAVTASKKTSISYGVILAQWALESGWGTSTLAVKCHNLGGIRFYGHAGTTNRKGFACYPTYTAFTADYIHTMNLPYYKKVRSAVGVNAECYQLGLSPYSASHYGKPPGINVLNCYHRLAPYL